MTQKFNNSANQDDLTVFKSASQLRNEVFERASKKTLSEIRAEVAKSIEDHAHDGDLLLDYYIAVGVNTTYLYEICKELNDLGYIAIFEGREPESNYYSISVRWTAKQM